MTPRWQAYHDYRPGELVEPTTPNGFVYRARRLGDPAPGATGQARPTPDSAIDADGATTAAPSDES